MRHRPSMALSMVLSLLGLAGCESDKGAEPAQAQVAPAAPAPAPATRSFEGLLPSLVGEHPGGAVFVGFSADGKFLVSTGRDRLAKVWSVDGSAPVRILKGHENDVLMAAFSPDGTRLASAPKDMTVRIWDLAKGKQLKVLKDLPPRKMSEEEQQEYAARPPALMNWVLWSKDGAEVISASDDFRIKFWDAKTGKKLKEYVDPGCRQRRIYHRLDGPGLAASAGCVDDGVAHLRLWDENGNIVVSHGDREKDAHFLAYDKAGRFLVGADGSTSYAVYSVQGTFLKRKLIGVYHFAVAFGPQDKTLLFGTQGGEVFVYDTENFSRLGKFGVGEAVAIDSLALSPTDDSLALGLRNGKVLRIATPVLP